MVDLRAAMDGIVYKYKDMVEEIVMTYKKKVNDAAAEIEVHSMAVCTPGC